MLHDPAVSAPFVTPIDDHPNARIIAGILKSTNYALDIFDEEEINALTLVQKKDKWHLKELQSGKDRPAKPEEIVRQLYLHRLMRRYGYTKDRLFLEKGVWFGSTINEKRADIVITPDGDPTAVYIIVEVKKPTRKDGLEQLKSYCNAEGAPIGVWTNGREITYLHRKIAPDYSSTYVSIPDIPRADQTLAQIINEQVTIDDLEKRNKLVTENLSLKSVILDLEDLVLANAGVDAFEEVFKLVYAKLYDEWAAMSLTRRQRKLEFRVDEAQAHLYDKIDRLFQEAKDKWPGAFADGEKIILTAGHLETCVSFLQDIKLFNSNLQIIDEAFEYLVTQVSKGAKGQYFTPRHAIDMAVKMLNPTDEEYVIDTAAGSCGFTMHSIFHVWGNDLTTNVPADRQREYASEMVYGLDFDPRSVKIAKAINLIAGDGRTHVFRVNTLDPAKHVFISSARFRGAPTFGGELQLSFAYMLSWDEEARQGLRDRLRRFPGDAKKTEWNRKNYRYFNFDVLLTNPPFAGEIKDARILHQYDVARREDGSWQKSMGRDELFVERDLDFLRPGGRAAIVLPQGRFNNINDERIRRFIAEQCRFLAVVGLHVNTFKPHTGTKTSMLFLQKWNDDPVAGPLCPHMSDYPIFFGTSLYSGKDTSGEYVYLKGPDGKDLLDLFGHKMIDHDLYSTRDMLAAQLARIGAQPHYSAEIRERAALRYEDLLRYVPDRPTITEAFIAFAAANGFPFWPTV